MLTKRAVEKSGYKVLPDGAWLRIAPEDFPFPVALYNLNRDPSELYDVQAAHPEIMDRLNKMAEIARADLGDELTGATGNGRRAVGSVN